MIWSKHISEIVVHFMTVLGGRTRSWYNAWQRFLVGFVISESQIAWSMWSQDSCHACIVSFVAWVGVYIAFGYTWSHSASSGVTTQSIRVATNPLCPASVHYADSSAYFTDNPPVCSNCTCLSLSILKNNESYLAQNRYTNFGQKDKRRYHKYVTSKEKPTSQRNLL